MKTEKPPIKYPLFKNRRIPLLMIGFIFIILASSSTLLALFNRYVPSKYQSSFTTILSPPRDVEGYFLNLLNEDIASTASLSQFPSELLFLPDIKNMEQLIPKESLKQISLHIKNRELEKCREEINSLNIEARSSVAASFAKGSADSGDFDLCEFFLQECRDGITFEELYDLDIQVIQTVKHEDWKDALLKSLQQNLALSPDAEEAKALQYVIRILFIGRIMEQETKIEEASSLYENSLKQIEQWTSDDLPLSWHYVLPASLHYRLWRSREKSFLSLEDTEKALAGMRQAVPVNRWTWRYHQAVRNRAHILMSSMSNNM